MTGARIRGLVLGLMSVAVSVAAVGCRCSRDIATCLPEVYMIDADPRGVHTEVLRWGHNVGTELYRLTEFRVRLPLHGDPSGEILEIYRDGLPLDIVGTPGPNAPLSFNDHGCPSRRTIRYDVSALPFGEYVVVHRRASIPSDWELLYGPPSTEWAEFEGEEALLMTLTMGLWTPDAGVGDAR